MSDLNPDQQRRLNEVLQPMAKALEELHQAATEALQALQRLSDQREIERLLKPPDPNEHPEDRGPIDP